MIFQGSRYTKTPVITPTNAEGASPRVLDRRAAPEAPGALEHVVSEGERLDQIANRYFAEPKKYWLVLDANPEVLNPFELLAPGRRIKIPRNRIVSE
jgi:Phage Tail Protein X